MRLCTKTTVLQIPTATHSQCEKVNAKQPPYRAILTVYRFTITFFI